MKPALQEMAGPRINLDKLVRRIVLDIALLKWFATNGGRKAAAQSAINLARADGDPSVLDFLERHVTERGTNG